MANARIQNKRDTTANWNAARGFVPLQGEMIIYTDYKQITKQEEIDGQVVNTVINVPGVKIGDGQAYVQDLPFIDDELRAMIMTHIDNSDIHTTLAEKLRWNNKVNIDDSYDIAHAELEDEALIFNRL